MSEVSSIIIERFVDTIIYSAILAGGTPDTATAPGPLIVGNIVGVCFIIEREVFIMGCSFRETHFVST